MLHRLVRGQEEEHRRIARELHDDLTQRLARLAIDAGSIELLPACPEDIKTRAHGMHEQLAALSEVVHSLSRQLHPSILDDLGLVDALRSECVSLGPRDGIVVRYRAEGVPRDLPRDVALCVYRVAQRLCGTWRATPECLRASVRLTANDQRTGSARAGPGRGVRGRRAKRKGDRPGEHARAGPPDPRPSGDPLGADDRNENHAVRTTGEESTVNRPRVLLADDHRLVAEGLQSLLAPHFDVVGIVPNGRELVSAAKALDPDVIVLDVSMPALNGIEAARQLGAADCRAKLIFLTVHREVAYAARALEAGASGYVLKCSAVSELITAIQEALRGGTYVTPQIAGDLLASFRVEVSQGSESSGELTPRQREVLQLVAEGRSAKEIATILGISRRTAEFHKARLMATLDVQSTAELVQYAIRTGVTSVTSAAHVSSDRPALNHRVTAIRVLRRARIAAEAALRHW